MVARDKSRLMTPGPTQAVRFSTSMSAIRFMRVVTSTTPPTSGTAPADRPVPAPRATTGTPCRRAAFTTAAASSVVSIIATIVGFPRYTPASLP